MEATIIFIFLTTLFLAYANGANDNFKGVATLYGSKTLNYKNALAWTTFTTALGCGLAMFLAGELIIVFKGKGLVPDDVILMQNFPLAVGAGAAITVMLATFLNLPVSTTHALIGSLAGAGWIATEAGINWGKLSKAYFFPLVAGPILSIVLTYIVYLLFKRLRANLNIQQETCLCIGEKVIATAQSHTMTKSDFINNFSTSIGLPEPLVASKAYCRSSYSGQFAGISARQFLDGLHYLSSGLVCFSRGLNDTPKIVALLLISSRFDLNVSILAVGIAMLTGGLIHSKRIAVTMGKKVTEMNPGQAFTANFITGIIVLGASKIGMPVSTTHVSCGSIFAIGAANKKINLKILSQIFLAWVTTLPLGFIFGLALMKALS
ncbi:MAG TPA: inorganic phosphate transporter [Nitrospinaceae bacterium]|jgi:PiT family inorganic phosphate transporter|nr:inorganic phosphate transporter [Nitrospinaceae bacterium]